MEYNTAKNKLINGEYGRHIQNMIAYAIGIKDRNLRNQQAEAIVRTMSYFSQGSKESNDYWHKLWDQLIVMSGFRLDIDSPYPKPLPEEETHPKPLPYPKHNIRIQTYGMLAEKIIKTLISEENSEEKDQTIGNIANYLKKQYLNWNRDSVNDTLIVDHLALLSGGKLKLKDDFKFTSTRDILNDLATSNVNNGLPGKKKKKKKKKDATTASASPQANANNQNKNNPNKNSKNINNNNKNTNNTNRNANISNRNANNNNRNNNNNNRRTNNNASFSSNNYKQNKPQNNRPNPTNKQS
jgi:hypothetical protein